MNKYKKPTFKILGYADLRKCRCYFQGDHVNNSLNVQENKKAKTRRRMEGVKRSYKLEEWIGRG